MPHKWVPRSYQIHWLQSYSMHTFLGGCHVYNPHSRTQYIYIYIHTFIHSYIHTLIHSYIHTFIHSYIHTFIHSYIHTFTHTYTHTHTYIHTHTYTHTYIHTHTHIYICMYHIISYHMIYPPHCPHCWLIQSPFYLHDLPSPDELYWPVP